MRVLFVSKPIAPPFHDGTKCLVRDIASSVTRVQPVVLSTPGAPPLGNAQQVPIYGTSGAFTPALAQNLRAAAWVLLRSRADVWHFVFAPNSRTSRVGRFLRAARDVPVVQTIASPPRSFDDADALLFGDVVVAQSRWSKDQVLRAHERKNLSPPRVEVIPPPVPLTLSRSAEQRAAARKMLDIPENAPLFVYPGDLEVSSGGRVTAELSVRLAREIPGALTVFAYRQKTARTQAAAEKLRGQLDPSTTRMVSSLEDVLSLVGTATAIVFPVDDLWGKVDLPIVLLEAMVLGVPVVVLGDGPLADLEGAVSIPSLELELWLAALLRLAQDEGQRRAVIAAQRASVETRHSSRAVATAYENLYLELGERQTPVRRGPTGRDGLRLS